MSGRPRDGECLSEAEAGAVLFRALPLPVCVHTSLLLLRMLLVNTQRCFHLTAHTEPYNSPKSGLPDPISGSGSSTSKAQSTASGRPASSVLHSIPRLRGRTPEQGSVAHVLSSAQHVLVGALAAFFLPLGFSSPPIVLPLPRLVPVSSQHPASSARASHS